MELPSVYFLRLTQGRLRSDAQRPLGLAINTRGDRVRFIANQFHHRTIHKNVTLALALALSRQADRFPIHSEMRRTVLRLTRTREPCTTAIRNHQRTVRPRPGSP